MPDICEERMHLNRGLLCTGKLASAIHSSTMYTFGTLENGLSILLIPLVTALPIVGENLQDDLPSDKQGWFSAPNYRSTLDILWLCLFTIFLCCWTAYHPNISHPDSTWRSQYPDRAIGFLVGVMFPEVLNYVAFFEWLDARATTKNLGENLKGVWTMTHAFYAGMGGFRVDLKANNPLFKSEDCLRFLMAPTIRSLFDHHNFDPKLLPSLNGVMAKGKADALVKLVTIMQILWVLIQSIARRSQHLPLTTLEISTLAYIPCAILSYALWWNKPYEPTESVDLVISTRLSEEGALDTRSDTRRPSDKLTSMRNCNHGKNNATSRKIEREKSLLLTERYEKFSITHQCTEMLFSSRLSLGKLAIPPTAVFLVIGSIHLAAWDFEFPSTTERWLWRACSLTITAIVPLSWLITAVILRVKTGRWWDGSECKEEHVKCRMTSRICMCIQGVAIAIYGIARLYLLVEVFMGLRSSPGGVYKTVVWGDFIPHVG